MIWAVAFYLILGFVVARGSTLRGGKRPLDFALLILVWPLVVAYTVREWRRGRVRISRKRRG